MRRYPERQRPGTTTPGAQSATEAGGGQAVFPDNIRRVLRHRGEEGPNGGMKQVRLGFRLFGHPSCLDAPYEGCDRAGVQAHGAPAEPDGFEGGGPTAPERIEHQFSPAAQKLNDDAGRGRLNVGSGEKP